MVPVPSPPTVAAAQSPCQLQGPVQQRVRLLPRSQAQPAQQQQRQQPQQAQLPPQQQSQPIQPEKPQRPLSSRRKAKAVRADGPRLDNLPGVELDVPVTLSDGRQISLRVEVDPGSDVSSMGSTTAKELGIPVQPADQPIVLTLADHRRITAPNLAVVRGRLLPEGPERSICFFVFDDNGCVDVPLIGRNDTIGYSYVITDPPAIVFIGASA